MTDPCKAIENQLKSLQAQRNQLAQQQAADLKDAPNKAAVIAQYKKETKALDAKITATRNKLETCWARRDVHVEGSEMDGLETLDDAVRIFMRRNGVRAGQLTVLKAGLPVLAHAYTFAGTGYPRTKPSSLFRIASCSKAFTCAAIDQLRNDPKVKLSLTAKVFPLLGIKPEAFAPLHDKRLDAITVDHLLRHAGGWNCHETKMLGDTIIIGKNWDPVFHVRDIARTLNLAGPPTKRQIAQYMYGEKLQFTPGKYDLGSTDGASYSNFGYVLLGLVVERLTSKPYISYLRENVLAPLGIKNVFLAPMLSKAKNGKEVTYDAEGKGPSPFQPMLFDLVPKAYGGAGFVTELMDAGGGLMCTATAMALFARRRAVWGLGGRMTAARSGGMAGTCSYMVSRGDDIDWAFVFNSRPGGDAADTLATKLGNVLNKLSIPTPQLNFSVV